MAIKRICALIVFLLVSQFVVFPLVGQAAEPRLVNVYLNQALDYSPNPVYLSASALYSDGSVKDVTYSGTWKTSSPSIASVYRGKVEFGSNTGNVTITFSYGGFEASVGTEVVDITDLEITTKNIKYNSKPVQLKAQGRYNNGELKEIKEHITWYSTNTDVASVDSSGLVTFRGRVGVAAIGIIFTSPLTQQTIRDEVVVSVTEQEVENDEKPKETMAFTVKIEGQLDPEKKTSSLKAYRLYIDDSKKTLENDLVEWSSSNPFVAEVSDQGLVTFTGKPGSVTITARYGNYSDSNSAFVPHKTQEIQINESLNFTPFFFNNPPKLTVTGKDNSGQSQLVHGLEWSSNNTNVALIDNNGQITFTGKSGNVTFTASKNGLNTNITITVPELPAKSVKSIFIKPSLFYSSKPQELQAFALMGDGSVEEVTKESSWTSSNEKIASVLEGIVYFTGLPGTVEIICTYQGFTDRDKVLVSVPSKNTTLDGIKFADHFLTYQDNGKALKVMGIYSNNTFKEISGVNFFSFQPNIAKVQGNSIEFSGLPGTATIEVQAGRFRTTIKAETVIPAGTNLPLYLRLVGDLDNYQKVKEIKALAVYPDGSETDITQEAVWNTTNTNIAKIQDKGKIEIVGSGPVRISAAYKNLNIFLSNKAYYQFSKLNPIKTELVPLKDIKTRIQAKLSQPVNLPLLNDIVNHWAQKELEMARRLGWMGGYQDGTMRPNSPMSRGEFASLAERALYLKTPNRFVNFSDTQNHWAKESIAVLANLGIVPIDSTRSYRPDEPITRGEMAQIINNMIQVRADTYYPFIDVPPSHFFATAVANTAQTGILAGMDTLHFRPNDNATRAQALAVLLRFLKTDPEMEGILNRGV
ncbi:MAG: hypothetical protein VR72_21875 [Clostridiaceae bacterium BRH_c20a]|nr:MAG: hypothetical protein VR72_21875 [Clostridiaceae bacterium BRH_c20a]